MSPIYLRIKLNKHILITAILTLTILLVGCERQQQVQPSGKTVKIGVIGPLSGIDKLKGTDGLKGINTVLHMYPFLNNGDAIELVLEDDKNEPGLTVKALNKLTKEDNVAAILILSTSASVLAVNAIADDYKTPILALLATHQDIAKNTSYVSQFCFDNIFQGMVAALYAMDELLIDRVAVFKDPDSFYSTSLADEFIRKYESLGGQVTDIIQVHTSTELTETILNVVRENGAELLYMPINGKKVIELVKTTKQMGWDPRKMGSDGLLSTVRGQYKEELNQLNGLLAIDFYTEQEPQTSFGEKAVKTYKKLFKGWSGTYAAVGAEGMAVVIDAMNRCAEPGDRECINAKLHSTKNFEGLMGMISIQPNGKAKRPLIVNTIDNGHMKFVIKVY